MANESGLLKTPPEQEKKDVDRFVNEGGPAVVAPKEVAKREEIWIETLEQKGGKERMMIVLDQDTEQRLQQMSRERGVTFENLIGTVLQKFSHDGYVERNLETKL